MLKWTLFFFLSVSVCAQELPSFSYSGDILDVVQRGSFRSVLTPREDVRLSSSSEGVIVSYSQKEGDRVKRGDVIIVLDPRMEEAELGRAQAILDISEAEKVRGEKEFKRMEPLFRENIASEKQYAEAIYLLAQAQGHYLEASQSVEVAKIRLEQRYVRSPIDGVFFKKNKSVGESIGRYEVVARVIDSSSLEFMLFLGPEYFGQFKVGDVATLELLDGPGRGQQATGTIVFVDSLIDPASGTFRVRMELVPTEAVVPGLGAKLVDWPGKPKSP